MPDCTGKVTAGPQVRQPGFQEREFRTQDPGGTPLHCLCHGMQAEPGVEIHEDMDMVRHDFQCFDGNIHIRGNLIQDFFQPCVHAIYQYPAPVFGIPDNMELIFIRGIQNGYLSRIRCREVSANYNL